MRPVDNRNLTLNVRREEGKIKVVVDALDKESQFLNFLQIQGSVLSPDLKRSRVELVQTAPGRYEGMVASYLPGPVWTSANGSPRSRLSGV